MRSLNSKLYRSLGIGVLTLIELLITFLLAIIGLILCFNQRDYVSMIMISMGAIIVLLLISHNSERRRTQLSLYSLQKRATNELKMHLETLEERIPEKHPYHASIADIAEDIENLQATVIKQHDLLPGILAQVGNSTSRFELILEHLEELDNSQSKKNSISTDPKV